MDYVLRTWPLVSPNATSIDVVGKILYLRQNYHFGPAKISMYLKRYLPSWSSTVSRRAVLKGDVVAHDLLSISMMHGAVQW